MAFRTVDGNLLRIKGNQKSLEICAVLEQDTAILQLTGSVTAELDHELADEILAFVSTGKNVRLDLKNLEHISNTFQRKLVEIQNEYIERSGVEMELFNVPAKLYERFKSGRLTTQLRIKREE